MVMHELNFMSHMHCLVRKYLCFTFLGTIYIHFLVIQALWGVYVYGTFPSVIPPLYRLLVLQERYFCYLFLSVELNCLIEAEISFYILSARFFFYLSFLSKLPMHLSWIFRKSQKLIQMFFFGGKKVV